MYEIIQVTAQYSNAVLVAILPHVSDFVQKLDLPVPTPITTNHVHEFKCSWRSDVIGGMVILSNGCEFAFVNGNVVLFRSPRSYFSLQDPDRIPEFYGDVKVDSTVAVEIARKAIKKLGHGNVALHADQEPVITPPPEVGEHRVPRYRIKWFDPDSRDPDNPSATVEFEVDASNGQIHMMDLLSPKIQGSEIKVNVQPPVLAKGPQTTYQGGRKITPVSESYSNVFLHAILPQFNDYIAKAGFELKLPLTTNDVDMSRYTCGIVEEDPIAFVFLKTGDRFHYRHGQVVGFISHDVVQMPGEAQRPEEKFLGTLNMSPEQAVRLVQDTVIQLGYTLESLGIEKLPPFHPPKNRGDRSFARYFIRWDSPDKAAVLVNAEVDAASGKLKSLFVNDRANTNLWRSPPQIPLEISTQPATKP